jgi:hypothetical protein
MVLIVRGGTMIRVRMILSIVSYANITLILLPYE